MTVDDRGRFRRRIYRSRSTARSGVLTLVAAAGFGVLAAAASSTRAQGLGLVMAPLCLILSLRAWTWGIHVDEAGIRVVGFIFSKRFAWEEIDHFAVLPLGTSPWAGTVLLRDGSPVGT